MQRGAVDPTHLQVRVGPGALGVQRATVRVIADLNSGELQIGGV